MSCLQLPRTIAWAMISMLLLLIPSSNALFAEDAGVLDVLVATAGHGSTRFVHSVVGHDSQVNSMVTSDATFTLGEFPTSCILASRNVKDGQVRWRRRVCVNALDAYPRHLVAAHDRTIVTLDASAQVLRAWEATTGDLLWERALQDKVISDHLPANATKLTVIHPVPDDATQVWFQLSGLVSREEADTEPKEKEEEQGEEDPLASALFAHWDLATGEPKDLKEEDKDLVDTVAPQDPTLVFCPAVLGKIPLAFGKNKNTITNTEGKAQKYKDLSNPDAYLESIAPVKISLSVQQQGMLQGIFLVDCSAERGVTLAATTSRSLTILLHLSRSLRRTTQWTADEGLAYLSPSALLLDHPHLTEENDENAAENMLSFASRLKQHGRALQETMDSVVSLFQGTDANDNAMSSFFGFPKMALLVSETANRLYGIPTAGPRRGQVQFAHNLHDQAVWHRLVHGVPNAAKAVRGVNSHVHHRDVLVVTGFVDNREKGRRTDDDTEISRTHVSWKCLDGATGRWIGLEDPQQSYEDDELHGLDAPVVQIVPVAATGSCRQGALLILENHEVVVALAPGSQLAVSDWDMFAHRLVHTQPSGLETLQLSVDAGSEGDFTATVNQVVGVTQFPGEDVVAVAYPGRDEVIQSPCHVLGDQSLLLKYLNPHLVVIMTTATSTASDDDSDDDKDPFAQAFHRVQDKHTKGASAAAAAGAKPQKRKPTGAGNAAASTTAPEGAASAYDDPNLFVNVVDSVSGRVLYRAAHANALLDSQAPPTLLVSENWVFYSFMNERTRRTEIGVLSLYEGMIDSKGLTAFSTGSSPDVITRFSSLDARESKPVVLAKTFSVAKPVTAMGVTHTRGGISGKKLIVATLDGGVYTVDRKMLEPRRPMGQVKESEKEEGLRQYSELVPIISYLSLSYTQPVEGVKYILSAPTELESQTVVLCFGGPDLFVTRTSPSRGFDLLPDSFSRIMLSIVVVVLMGIYLVLQRIVFQKTVRKGWV